MIKYWIKKHAQTIAAIAIVSFGMGAIGAAHAQAVASEEFFLAVINDNTSVLARELSRGTDPNARGGQGQLPLVLALREGSLRVAAALVAHPATQIDLANDSGETPLMMAALKGQQDWMRQLLARGAKLEREGWTPLHYAATGAGLDGVQMLVGQGATLDPLSPNGTTPLMMAARYGSIDAAQWLLSRGANAKLRNQLGLSAGDFARLGGRESLAETLDAAAR